jgi:hypothetical protein
MVQSPLNAIEKSGFIPENKPFTPSTPQFVPGCLLLGKVAA